MEGLGGGGERMIPAPPPPPPQISAIHRVTAAKIDTHIGIDEIYKNA